MRGLSGRRERWAEEVWPFSSASDVFSRNSWVMAMPMLEKAREVRSQARNVRSSARWSRATEPLFSSEMERYEESRRAYHGCLRPLTELEGDESGSGEGGHGGMAVSESDSGCRARSSAKETERRVLCELGEVAVGEEGVSSECRERGLSMGLGLDLGEAMEGGGPGPALLHLLGRESGPSMLYVSSIASRVAETISALVVDTSFVQVLVTSPRFGSAIGSFPSCHSWFHSLKLLPGQR